MRQPLSLRDPKKLFSFALHEYARDLLSILRAVRARAHGGTILIVPNSSENWKRSIKEDSGYRLSKDPQSVPELRRRRSGEKKESRARSKQICQFDSEEQGYFETIGGLAAIDGAVLIRDDFELIGFGALIESKGEFKVDRWEPVMNGKRETLELRKIGGARHQSAARFVFEHPDALAIVVSEDGPVSIFLRGSSPKKVQQIHHAEWLIM